MGLKLVLDENRMEDLLRPQNRIKHSSAPVCPWVQGETLFIR